MVQPGRLLQLTNSSDIIGYAFHRAPLHFRGGTVQSFSLSFVFAVQSEFDKESSGGMAFFIAPGRNFSGAMPGSFLGLFNASTNGRPDNHIFVVELDTFGNGEFKDIDSNHVGIDINGLISIESHTAGFYDDDTGSFTNLSLNSGDPMQLWVEYDAQTTQIVSTLAPLGAAKPRRPLFTTTANLSDVLQNPSFLGFSGSSGSLSTLYSVLGWSFAMDGPAPAINITNLPKDIKASNVLLDGEMNGRLGDFGLARLYDHGTDLQTTHVVGTLGYLAPELLRSGKASPLTDVFAFGTFLLEVACGQRPIKQDNEDKDAMLVDWVLEHWHNGTLLQTVDTKLQCNYEKDEASMVLKLGLLTNDPRMRESRLHRNPSGTATDSNRAAAGNNHRGRRP
ncbi:hypothetical protein QYE76_009681 [Lolium multiflorum]|uniref:non-specific serine/threonine protein kinase n=1 Tax=Lolium multiflorum TaxID=4521 RepID=A0AAD8TVG8_LOLMU|nr:hypothetical protein QYE76_009681 [Lolium multiflorum]